MKQYDDIYVVIDETIKRNFRKYTILPPFKWTFKTLNEAFDKVNELNEKHPFMELSIQKSRTLNKKFVLSEKKKELEQQLEEINKELGE